MKRTGGWLDDIPPSDEGKLAKQEPRKSSFAFGLDLHEMPLGDFPIAAGGGT